MSKRLLVALAGVTLAAGLFLALAGQPSDAELLRRAREVARAYRGLVSRPRYVTLIDYRRSLLARRLAVVDTRGAGRVVLRARVSHAWNSGLLYATRFSDVNGSRCSSKGVFLTEETFAGRYGPSLRVRGLSPGVNGNARQRAIIFHPGLTYSAGCFMTAPDVNGRLISLIRDGSLVAVIE